MKSDTIWFGLLAKSAFSGLGEYYRKSESLFESAREKDSLEIQEEIKTLARDLRLSKDEEYGEWSLKMQEHEEQYDMLFTNFLRYSFIVLAYLVLEDHLHRFCMALQDAKGPAAKPVLKPGSNAWEYREYINTRVSVQASLWEGVEDLRFIRNCITHASGNVARSNCRPDLHRIANKNVGISISSRGIADKMTPLYLEGDMILIEPQYCKSVVHDIGVLLETICKAADLPTTMRFENGSIIFD